MRALSPSQLNDMFRLCLLADRYGPQLLDNRQRFDEVIGRDRFGGLSARPAHPAN